MIPNSYRPLINELSKKTEKGNVNWKMKDHLLEVNTGEEIFVLWAGTDERTEEGFVSFGLRDFSGNNIDNWFVDADNEDYDLMHTLFTSAKRHALGISARLEKLQAKLTSSFKIGF